MRLRREVVDLVGLYLVDPPTERRGIGEIGVVELHESFGGVVGVDVDVLKALGVEVGGPSDETVDFVVLGEEKLRQVGSILSGDPCDQGDTTTGNSSVGHSEKGRRLHAWSV